MILFLCYVDACRPRPFPFMLLFSFSFIRARFEGNNSAERLSLLWFMFIAYKYRQYRGAGICIANGDLLFLAFMDACK